MAPKHPKKPANPASSISSPYDLLISFQQRRENRALLDLFEEQQAKLEAEIESQSRRQEEIERRLQEFEKDRQEMTEGIQQLRQQDEEIKEDLHRSVSELEKALLSAGLPSGTAGSFADNAEDDDEQQAPASSPPNPGATEQPRAPSQVDEEPSATFVPPHQRYPTRRGRAAGPAAGPSSTVAANIGRNNGTTDSRANLSRKRSIPPVLTPTTPGPPMRTRSNSSSSTLSTVPSSSSPGSPEPAIPDLPFNKRGTPTQGALPIDLYFLAAKKFALDRGVHQESEEEQTSFILQIFKGMKKEERSEVVAKLEEVSLAKLDFGRKTVQFVGLWGEIAEAVDEGVLEEVKAKVALMRATMLVASA